MVAGIDAAKARKAKEDAVAAAAPPVKGTVFLSGNSRIIFEYPDDLMRVYYMLEVVNNARNRVDIGGPLIIDLPKEASGAAALDGNSQQATVAGNRITVLGPFAAGITPVQIAFQLPFSSSSITLTQAFPVMLEEITVGSQKIPGLMIGSKQFSSVGTMKAGDGSDFLLASGGAVRPGGTLSVTITGLPVHSTTPRNVALILALGIAMFGVWLSRPGPSNASDTRKRLLARRETLLAELAQIEDRFRNGRETAKDASRKPRVIAELEQIYGEIDAASPHGGGEGLAA
jgi:hypothetical protein